LTKELSIVVPGLIKQGAQLKFNRKTGSAYRPKEHTDRKKNVARVTSAKLRSLGIEDEQFPYFKKGTPIQLGVLFLFPYLDSHYDKGSTAEAEIELGYRDSLLKSDVPKWCMNSKDIDNMLKPLKDGMKGIAYDDDKEIVSYSQHAKLYSLKPGTMITLRELE
jgi:Holliday junction resolvase RusA-like endonuclease